MKTRKAISLFDEDSSFTLLKPYSDEYRDSLFVISEDAHGEFSGILTPIVELKNKLNITDEELNKLIANLI